MVKGYSRDPAVPAKAVKARATDIRVHFKNTYEVARVIKGMGLKVAIKYLRDVLNKKRCIPFTRFRNHTGRTAQAKEFGTSTGRWPQKSVKVVLGLLQNLQANAAVKGLDEDKLVLTHAAVDRAPKGRRRTYRAHGRIGRNTYLNSPSHLELFATLREEDVKKEANKKPVAKLSKKQIARQRLRVGEQ